MAENSLTSHRYEMLAKLGSNADVLRHIANRFSQQSISLVTQKELQQMIENYENFESNRLSRAMDGKYSTNFSTPSYSDLPKVKAEENWPLARLDNLEAMIFLDEYQNPLVIYKANGMPLGDWLSRENQFEKFEKTSEVLNDALLSSLRSQGVIFQNGKLYKDGAILTLQELENCSRELNQDPLKQFANQTKVVVLSTEPSASNQLAKEAESITNPYSTSGN